MKGLDLRRFHKISEDHNCATLKHPSGHEIKIAKGGLSSSLRDQLSKLPMKMAEGGKVQKYADGTPDQPVQVDPVPAAPVQDPTASMPVSDSAQDSPEQITGDVAAQAQNQDLNAQNDAVTDHKNKLIDYFQSLGSGLAGSSESRADDQIEKENELKSNPDSFSQSSADRIKGISQAAEPQVASVGATGDFADRAPAENTPQAADTAEQAPVAQSLAPAAKTYPSIEPGTEQTQQPQQMSVKDKLNAHDAAFSQDLASGKITPETYGDIFAKKDTLGKLGMIFGSLVGGMGSGLSKQPNLFMELMKQQIENDTKAQQQSFGNAIDKNKLNLQRQKQEADIKNIAVQQGWAKAQTQKALLENSIQSDAFSRMSKNRTFLQSTIDQMNKLPQGSPQRQQFEQAIPLLMQGVNTDNYSLSNRAQLASTMMGGLTNQNGGSEQQFQNKTTALRLGGNKEMAENMEAKHLPGFTGQASANINPKNSDELKKMAISDQQLGRLIDWSQQHSGVLPDSPKNVALINQGKVLARNAQAAYRESTLNTIYRPGEQPLLDQAIPSDPTQFLNKWRVIPQLQTIQSENMSKLNNAASLEGLGKYVGFGGGGQSQQPSQGSLKEGQTGQSKSGKAIVVKNGAWTYK